MSSSAISSASKASSIFSWYLSASLSRCQAPRARPRKATRGQLLWTSTSRSLSLRRAYPCSSTSTPTSRPAPRSSGRPLWPCAIGSPPSSAIPTPPRDLCKYLSSLRMVPSSSTSSCSGPRSHASARRGVTCKVPSRCTTVRPPPPIGRPSGWTTRSMSTTSRRRPRWATCRVRSPSAWTL